MTVSRSEKKIIIITDIVKDAKDVVDKLKKANNIDFVLFASIRSQKWKEIDAHVPGRKKAIYKEIENILGKSIVDSLKNKINRVFIANVSGFPILLSNFVEKISTGFEISLIEDGLSSYSRIYEKNIGYWKNNNSIIKRMAFRLIPPVITKVKKMFLFSPELLVWKPPYDIIQIEPIDNTNESLINTLNVAFDYQNLKDDYSEKAIFFEESYIQDGISVDDLEIVNKLIGIFGIKELFVKRHPRVSKDRFSNLGVKCNQDTSIPWEVILLNNDFSEKYLVTMTSTAVVNSILLLKSSANIVFEYSVLESVENSRIKYSIEVIKRLEALYPGNIYKLNDVITE